MNWPCLPYCRTRCLFLHIDETPCNKRRIGRRRKRKEGDGNWKNDKIKKGWKHRKKWRKNGEPAKNISEWWSSILRKKMIGNQAYLYAQLSYKAAFRAIIYRLKQPWTQSRTNIQRPKWIKTFLSKYLLQPCRQWRKTISTVITFYVACTNRSECRKTIKNIKVPKDRSWYLTTTSLNYFHPPNGDCDALKLVLSNNHYVTQLKWTVRSLKY